MKEFCGQCEAADTKMSDGSIKKIDNLWFIDRDASVQASTKPDGQDVTLVTQYDRTTGTTEADFLRVNGQTVNIGPTIQTGITEVTHKNTK